MIRGPGSFSAVEQVRASARNTHFQVVILAERPGSEVHRERESQLLGWLFYRLNDYAIRPDVWSEMREGAEEHGAIAPGDAYAWNGGCPGVRLHGKGGGQIVCRADAERALDAVSPSGVLLLGRAPPPGFLLLPLRPAALASRVAALPGRSLAIRLPAALLRLSAPAFLFFHPLPLCRQQR
jgi:hypothetical protein